MNIGFNLSKPFAVSSIIIPFLIYLYTLAPSVWIIDSSELAFTASKLGIAHPTGYPLFTILGRIFVLLLPAEPAVSLNIMSAVYVSASLLILFLSGCMGSITCLKRESPYIIYTLFLIPVLILGFTLTIWDFATSLEVYSLQMLFFAVLFFILFRIYRTTGRKKTGKLVFLLAFVFGLSFTNHLTSVILAPSIAYMLFIIRKKINFSLRAVITACLLFLTGLSVYVYLPVRNPSVIFNWGDPGSFQNVLKHVTGAQYARYKVNTGILNSIGNFIERIPMEFTWPLLIIIAAGCIYLYRMDKRIFTFLSLILVSNLAVTSFYNIPDISNYYLAGIMVLSVFSGYGIIYLYTLAKPHFRHVIYIMPLIIFIPLSANFGRSDKHDIDSMDKFSSNLFNSLEQNSILLTGKWDYIVTPSLYYQYIKNIRPDITIIDIKLIKTSWYIKYLIKAKPELYELSKPYFDAHLDEAVKFESDKEKYLKPGSRDEVEIANGFRAAYMKLLKNIVETHPGKLYTTYDVPADSTFWILDNYKKIPVGILLKYCLSDTLIEYDDLKQIDYSLPQYDSPYFKSIKNYYAVSLIARAKYLTDHKKNGSAKKLLEKALEIDPGFVIAKDLLRKLE